MAGFDLSNPLGQALISQGQQFGYDPDHIAGALGTAMTESSMNPASTGDYDANGNPTSFGGFQWHDRFPKLQQFAASQGKSWQDPNVQAQFWYQEHAGPEAKAGFNGATGLGGVTQSVLASQRPQNWDSDPSVGQKYLKNIVDARRALAASNGEDPSSISAPMAYADDDSSGGSALGAIRAATAGRTGALGQPTANDADGLRNMLARFGGSANNNNTAAPETNDPVEKFGNGLTRFGAALMARDNPNAAYVLLNGIKGQAKATTNQWKDEGVVGDGKFRRMVNTQTGQERYDPIEDQYQDHDKETEASNKDIDRNRKQFQVNTNLADTSDDLLSRLNKYRQAIAEGRLHVSAYDRAHGFTSNITNSSNENDADLKSMEADLNKYILTTMNTLERGASTGKQLAAAEASIVPQGGKYSDRTVLDALDKMAGLTQGIHNNAARANASVLTKYPTIGDTGLVDPETQKDQDAAWYKQRYQDRMNNYTQFEKDQAPRRKQFIENFNKPKSPTGGASTSFTDRFKQQFGTGGGGPVGTVQPQAAAPVQDDSYNYFDPR